MEVKNEMRVKCDCCKFVQRDKKASDRNWTAYKCTNIKSYYFGALLNVTYSGYKCVEVCWKRCDCGEYDSMAAKKFARLRVLAENREVARKRLKQVAVSYKPNGLMAE